MVWSMLYLLLYLYIYYLISYRNNILFIYIYFFYKWKKFKNEDYVVKMEITLEKAFNTISSKIGINDNEDEQPLSR